MSSERENIILNDVPWFILYDENENVVGYNGEELTMEQYLNQISNIPVNLTSLPGEDENVIFLYPTTGEHSREDPQAVDAVKYRKSNFNTALDVIGLKTWLVKTQVF